ncbi:unnamed protein product [Notodromas monacha]|uniref:Ribonuclease 3 n=1 Tax=Notodromas monacha TaxID=399045 RepID=A0A7R9BDN7_9CRUS|nr:unnamed protein product [Notodromas monacha]CAG0912870.1 unnamed protein product [Notodromas monacha]
MYGQSNLVYPPVAGRPVEQKASLPRCDDSFRVLEIPIHRPPPTTFNHVNGGNSWNYPPPPPPPATQHYEQFSAYHSAGYSLPSQYSTPGFAPPYPFGQQAASYPPPVFPPPPGTDKNMSSEEAALLSRFMKLTRDRDKSPRPERASRKREERNSSYDKYSRGREDRSSRRRPSPGRDSARRGDRGPSISSRTVRGRKRSRSRSPDSSRKSVSPPRKIARPPRGPPSPLPSNEELPFLEKKPEKPPKKKANEAEETIRFYRCSPADLYYERDPSNPKVFRATQELKALCERFESELLSIFPKPEAPEDTGILSEVSDDDLNDDPCKPAKSCSAVRNCLNKFMGNEEDSGDESDSSVSSARSSDLNEYFEEEERRMREKPAACQNAMHPDLYYNEIHKRNMGPICKCSSSSRKLGIRHGVYVGEKLVPPCNKWTNNGDKLYHYKVTLAPPTNFLVKCPTTIVHDGHEFLFEGFSLFSHYELHSLPPCQLFRFYIHYTIDFENQPVFDALTTVHELNLFRQYVFFDLLELYDLELKIGLTYQERMKQAWEPVRDDVNCDLFHFMPRFVRQLPESGLEILSMNYVLDFLLKSWQKLISPWDIEEKLKAPTSTWADYAESLKEAFLEGCLCCFQFLGAVVCRPDKRPRSLRVDQLDRDDALLYAQEYIRQRREKEKKSKSSRRRDEDVQWEVDKLYPDLVHFGVRPAHLTTEYHKAYREFLKARYLLVNKPRPTAQDKEKLLEMERELRKLRTQPAMRREVTVGLSTKDFFVTGLFCDVVQHMLFLPILVCHLRFHKSLDSLESAMQYRFKNRYLLQLALTHPSYRENYGTNPDHSRNTQTNCGIRQAEYGDRDQIGFLLTGIVTLMKIMSQFGTEEEADSETMDNQRLEFFGDAVVEFLTSIHLFFMFPDQEEGSLATFRAALVQNSHLTHLARILELHKYFLYSHGPDLCLELPLRRAMANCFEALLGAIYLDGGLEAADKLLAETIFREEPSLLTVWVRLPLHPLQQQEPNGDRHLIPRIPYLQKLRDFEGDTGVEFNHIRLLARAFTDHSVGMTNLTLGSNQRLEFLGDTVLQLIVTEHLYLHFPSHHEGHLSLLRTTLVNNKTQAIVCDELGMARFSLSAPHRKKVVVGESQVDKPPLKMKDKADLLEAYLGSLYVDQGLEICKAFCRVCFFPRLNEFILNQDWNDPKSKLQQCCLTLRSLGESEPDIPVYTVVGCVGPTNTRIYTVAVSFRGEELARASAPSIKQAEMDAAKCALETQRALDRLRRQKRHEKRMCARANPPQIRDRHAKQNVQKHDSDIDSPPKTPLPNPQGNNGPGDEKEKLKDGTGKRKRRTKKRKPWQLNGGVPGVEVPSSTATVLESKSVCISPGDVVTPFVLVAPALPSRAQSKTAVGAGEPSKRV